MRIPVIIKKKKKKKKKKKGGGRKIKFSVSHTSIYEYYYQFLNPQQICISCIYKDYGIAGIFYSTMEVTVYFHTSTCATRQNQPFSKGTARIIDTISSFTVQCNKHVTPGPPFPYSCYTMIDVTGVSINYFFTCIN